MDEHIVGIGEDIVGVGTQIEDILSGGEYGGDAVGALGPRRVARLQRRPARRLRRLFLPVAGNVSVAANTTVNFTANPQHHFKPERLTTIGGAGLLITNILVGTDSQFVAAGSIPVEFFQAANEDVTFNADTGRPGVEITITVQNPTAAPIVFSAAVLGTVIRA